MIIRDHEPSPEGPYCRHCGAKSLNGTFGDQATCTPREVVTDPHIRPEPERRQFAIEDFDVISSSIIRIRAQADVRCPQNSGRTLYDCLRSTTACGESCEFRKDWIGPE